MVVLPKHCALFCVVITEHDIFMWLIEVGIEKPDWLARGILSFSMSLSHPTSALVFMCCSKGSWYECSLLPWSAPLRALVSLWTHLTVALHKCVIYSESSSHKGIVLMRINYVCFLPNLLSITIQWKYTYTQHKEHYISIAIFVKTLS